jgi:hypothetical protein
MIILPVADITKLQTANPPTHERLQCFTTRRPQPLTAPLAMRQMLL